jgi:hypothetical protein
MLVGVLIVAAVVILLVWIVPLRRRGIRGIGTRKPKLSGILSESAAEDERLRRSQPGDVPPQASRRPSGQEIPGHKSPAQEVPGQKGPGQKGPGHDAGQKTPGQPSGPDGRLLSELDKTWEPGYADRIEALHRSRKR